MSAKGECLHGLGCTWFNLQKNLFVKKDRRKSHFSHTLENPQNYGRLWSLFFLLVDNSSVLDISWRTLCKPDICLYFSLNVSVYPVTSV